MRSVPEWVLSPWCQLTLALTLTLTWSCGTATGRPVTPDGPTLARAQAVNAAQRAPDLWQRAEAAEQLARQADDDPAAQDFTTEARLWRQAAIAEAERIEALQKQTTLRAEIDEKAKRLAALQAEHTHLKAECERLAAGRLALAEATRVLQLSADDRRRRPELSEAELRQGAEALLDRARLVTAAARAMGAPLDQVDALNARAARIGDLLAKSPDRALHAADVLLFDAHANLGPLRTGQSDPAQRQTLRDALQAAGLSPSRSERGLRAGLSKGPGTARKLQRLCKLREAFPAGAFQVVASRATLASWKRQLSQAGCAKTVADWQSGADQNGSGVEFVWLGY